MIELNVTSHHAEREKTSKNAGMRYRELRARTVEHDDELLRCG
jgi:hypothetical protein